MAQIEFFSTIEDEIKMISQIAKDDSIKYSLIENNRLTKWTDLKEITVPDTNTNFEICIWKTDLGDLKWLSKEPQIDSSSHSKLVKSLSTKEHWNNKKELTNFSKMIDDENSPILYYKRGELIFDYQLPNLIISPQSSIDKINNDFKKWFNRTVSWIRRNSEMIYNWKMTNTKLRNDMSFMNSIYALENAKQLINTDSHNFAISINKSKFDK